MGRNDQQRAAFLLYYTNKRRDQESYTDSVIGKPTATITPLPDGVSVDYAFNDLGLRFRMVKWLFLPTCKRILGAFLSSSSTDRLNTRW